MSFYDLELVHVAYKNLRGRGLRSFLTVLGIVIGIAAIVALVAVGEGLNQSVAKQFQSLGTGTLFVLPGGGFAESVLAKLSDGDAETIEEMRGVDFAAPIYITTMQTEYKQEIQSAMVVGVDPAKVDGLARIGMFNVAEGRALTENDASNVVLGANFGKNILNKEIGLRQSIEIEGKSYRIVGILDKAQNNFAVMFNTAIIMSKDELQELSDDDLSPFRIVAAILPSEDLKEAKEQISEALEDEHGKKDFQIMDLQQVSEIAGSVVGMISLVLIGIASISLLVGGIGIMNTMLMSVLERTREVGLMKAIGATTPHILSIFIVEAGMIGLAGGTIGLLVGIGTGSLISFVAEFAGLPLQAIVSPLLIAGALSFSMIIGMTAGVYPAFRATKIDPVEALRFE